jgi:hypothetical protein
MRFAKLLAWSLALSFSAALYADDGARFDLAGPRIEVRVTRGGTTLPIAQVPNLQPGDKLWVKADLPPTQSNHLLLIVAFLRGTTNQPPEDWFTEIDTWDKKKTAEGTTITVPAEAEQALLFVAPETGGDFKTLRSAVRGRPGIFIRADSDLNEASFEQQRTERYLAAMQSLPAGDAKAIQDHSAKLAATLALKPNPDCFKQPVDAQVNCLTQTSAPVLLNDGHGESIAEALSSGPASDFVNSASLTQAAGGGLYSAYVGSIIDLVHLVSLLRTAQYQYIPGLSFPQGDTLNLKLNAPVSFLNPKSVIVVGLPAIQKAKLPPLRAHDPDQVACLLDPKMTLPLEGAPLVFSTSFAHDLVLHLNRTGAPTDISLKPDAFEGGLVVTKAPKRQLLPEDKPGDSAAPAHAPVKMGSATDLTITGTVHGDWGFDSFTGPTLTVQQVDGKDWKIVGDTQLMAGQDNHLTLHADGAACVKHIALTNTKDKDVDVTFKPAAGEDGKTTLDLDVALQKMQPGGYALAIEQYGDAKQDKVPLTAYTSGIHLDRLQIHAGDNAAILTGQGLQDVVSVEIDKIAFKPAGADNSSPTLHLETSSGVSPANGSDARVTLKDGRTMTVKISTEAPRPSLKLLSFNATPNPPDGNLPIQVSGNDVILLDGQLTFVVQTKDVFPRNQTIEVATVDESVHTTLSLNANNLVLQDEHTAVAMLDPRKAFGQSAFGKLQMRPVAADGTPGDWTTLGTLVREPRITAIQCTTTDAPTCQLQGSNLFLVQSFSATKDFAKPTDVPTGFAAGQFNVPTPADGTTLYLKLRDDPAALASITLPTPVQKPTPPATPAASPAASPAAPTAPPADAPTTTPPTTPTPPTAAPPATTPPTTTPPANPPASTPSPSPAGPSL